jgi:hypothetical protein
MPTLLQDAENSTEHVFCTFRAPSIYRNSDELGWCSLPVLVLLRIQGLGFKDPTLWPFFAGERKSGSSRHGFESLLPGKKHPKLPKISQIWAIYGTKKIFSVFSAFLRVYPFGVNRDYCYGSFFVEFGDSDPKDPDRIQIHFLEWAQRFGNLNP